MFKKWNISKRINGIKKYHNNNFVHVGPKHLGTKTLNIFFKLCRAPVFRPDQMGLKLYIVPVREVGPHKLYIVPEWEVDPQARQTDNCNNLNPPQCSPPQPSRLDAWQGCQLNHSSYSVNYRIEVADNIAPWESQWKADNLLFRRLKLTTWK